MIGATSGSSSTIQAAQAAMRAGRWEDARGLLVDLTRAQPKLADGRHLYGVVLRRMGDMAGAEREFLAALALDRRNPVFHADLGVLQAAAGRPLEAEKSFRAALAADPTFLPAALPLTELLSATGRGSDAADVSRPLAEAPGAGEAILAAHAEALKAAGRPSEALSVYERSVLTFPHSAVAEHNVATSLVDLGRHAQAEAAVQRVFAKGLNAPETWLVLGRALQGQDKFDLAQQAFEQAIRLRPGYAMAHAELGQLIWMLTEDKTAATTPVDAVIKVYSKEPSLRMVKARLLEYAGDQGGAYSALKEAADRPNAPTELLIAASRSAASSDPEKAFRYARDAMKRGDFQISAAQMALCEALLALGRVDDAANVVALLRTRLPLDQHVLAYQATIWRLQGDPRYRTLHDYQALVRCWTLDTPPGWSTLAAFLSDLKTSLTSLHTLRAHPVGQSLRGGTQTNRNLLTLDDPVIQAFFKSIDGPIRRHVEALGSGQDTVRVRRLDGYEVAGAWSVRLQPGSGRHVDHVHQKGWLSSACYIDLPAAIDAGDDEGWIKFGEPGIPTRPALTAEHKVKPQPGMLVLFPSYMWHGTIPFSGDQPRLTVAFDLLPAT